MVANHLTSVGDGTGEWQTPQDLFQLLNKRWNFTLDAWASHDNALCKVYATSEGTFTKGWLLEPESYPLHPEPRMISRNDGFQASWMKRRVFGNPPYTRGLIEPCVEKFVKEVTAPREFAPECAVYLVPCAPDTAWYQLLETVATCTPLPKRVRFIHPMFECGPKCQTGKTPHLFGKPNPNPPGPMVIAEARIPTDHWREVL